LIHNPDSTATSALPGAGSPGHLLGTVLPELLALLPDRQ
jgi:hypothetical protein